MRKYDRGRSAAGADRWIARAKAIIAARRILARVGCTLEVEGDIVTLRSPKTGAHSLCLRQGVRPASDLVIHAQGFAENQR